MTQKSIVFDLDDTICYPVHAEKDTHAKYALARPNTRVITSMRQLKDKGYHIIINSARRMVTHDGDIDKIIEDVGQVTIDWLEQYRVPYDELRFGKPYSSTWYVDDKAMDLNQFYKWVDYEVSSSR
jgi:capsule biosynthesis phosphatase